MTLRVLIVMEQLICFAGWVLMIFLKQIAPASTSGVRMVLPQCFVSFARSVWHFAGGLWHAENPGGALKKFSKRRTLWEAISVRCGSTALELVSSRSLVWEKKIDSETRESCML